LQVEQRAARVFLTQLFTSADQINILTRAVAGVRGFEMKGFDIFDVQLFAVA
jgi:hypothetical protein